MSKRPPGPGVRASAEEPQWLASLLRALTQCQVEFLTAENPQEAFDRLLANLLHLTDSEYGFIGEVLRRDGKPYLKTHAITDISWDRATRDFYAKNAPQSMEFVNLDTLFGSALLTGELTLSNEPANDPRAGGLPAGHPPLNSFLGIPLTIGDALVGMAGIANRPGGYDNELFDRLEPFRITTAALIQDLQARRDREAAVAALASSQEKLSAVFEGILDGLVLIDARGVIVDLNPAACALFLRDRAGTIGSDVSILMPSPDDDRHPPFLRTRFRGGVSEIIGTTQETVARRADGSTFPCTVGVSDVHDGDARFFVATIRDITERRRQEEGLRLAKAALEEERWRLENIIAGTNVGTWEWNVQTGETRFNERWCEIIGYSLAELGPVSIETWMEHANPDDLQASNEALERHFRGEADFYEFECRMKHRDGHWVWVLDRGKVFSRSKDGRPLMMFGTHQDISKQKAYEAQIEHMATHDPLTNLPTSRILHDRIGMAVERAKREGSAAAVFFADLDGFKDVNDEHGHQIGDDLLRMLAERLQQSVRSVDTIARIGGDEFLVVCGDISRRKDAREIATNLLRRVHAPFDIAGKTVRVGMSIGIALFPDDGTDPETLIRAADTAMYRVKGSGKNGVAFHAEAPDAP